ncbi:hypothetical protein AVEN_51594-1 [Araneus ventricosus]|uniref:Uncharacterized protein n=1 Tax=Araneus ventricosus TaxID=182803 RepID=A0A4Y2N781_ARAVE|nr:hypothetical protein AVEN_51594-1 [Araneus ventricosus]
MVFTDEIAILALFDDDVDEETKLKMVSNLHREIFSTHEKRYIHSKEELSGSLYEKSVDDFISVKSQSLFSRLKISDSFLNESPSSWGNNASFLDAKKTFSMLRAVNDTAERARTRSTPELEPSSPNYHTTPKGGRVLPMYDLVSNRPHTCRILSGIGLRFWRPEAPKPRPYH